MGVARGSSVESTRRHFGAVRAELSTGQWPLLSCSSSNGDRDIYHRACRESKAAAYLFRPLWRPIGRAESGLVRTKTAVGRPARQTVCGARGSVTTGSLWRRFRAKRPSQFGDTQRAPVVRWSLLLLCVTWNHYSIHGEVIPSIQKRHLAPRPLGHFSIFRPPPTCDNSDFYSSLMIGQRDVGESL